MFGSGQETPDVQGYLPDIREWSGDNPGCPGVPPGYPGMVGRQSRISGSGRETFLDVRK